MPGEREWQDYLDDMLKAAEHLVIQTAHATDREIFDERGPQYGDVLYQLMVMGEAAKHLPAAFRESHPELDWTGIIGMRDRITHGYFAVVR
ncbi:MAG: DUF86 domain-containing protein [Coriobacteriales bacterium]|nr:DUF86 domain-containing protein [Coriobacteriales bacterium]